MTVTEIQVERELATAGDWAVSPVSLAAVYRSWVRSEHRGLDGDGITEIKVVPQATSASCCRVGRRVQTPAPASSWSCCHKEIMPAASLLRSRLQYTDPKLLPSDRHSWSSGGTVSRLASSNRKLAWVSSTGLS